jgi:hypothetical protein
MESSIELERRLKMDYSKFLDPQVLILVVVIYAIGMMLKNTKKIPNQSIPFILLVVALVLCIFLLGLNVNAFIQAVIVTATAVYTNQLMKQSSDAMEKVNDTIIEDVKPPEVKADTETLNIESKDKT